MLSNNDFELLQLNTDFVRRDLEFSRHLGLEYANKPDNNRLNERQLDENPLYGDDEYNDRVDGIPSFSLNAALSASHYRQAGANGLLVYESRNREEIFGEAAQAYARINIPYALNMAAFTSEKQPIRLDFTLPNEFNEEDSQTDATSQNIDLIAQLVYVLLADIDPKYYDRVKENVPRRKIITLRESLEEYRRVPVGILDIPVSNYLDLADALDYSLAPRDREVSWQEAVLPFIVIYNEAIKAAMDDDYHWQRLALDFHPAEPDIFGVMLRVQSILAPRNAVNPLLQFIESLPIARVTRTLLLKILGDYQR